MVFSTWGWVRRHLFIICPDPVQMTKLRNSRGGPFVSSISAVASVTTVTTGQCPQPPRWRNKPVQRSDDNSARPQRRNDRLFCAFRDNKYHSRGAEQGSRHRATDRGRLRQCCRQYCAYLLQLAAAASCCLNNQLLRAHDFYKTRIDILRLVRALHCFWLPLCMHNLPVTPCKDLVRTEIFLFNRLLPLQQSSQKVQHNFSSRYI